MTDYNSMKSEHYIRHSFYGGALLFDHCSKKFGPIEDGSDLEGGGKPRKLKESFI